MSLIKYVPSRTMWGGDMEQTLTDFYMNGICPGRTVATQSNAYVSLFQTAKTCLSTKFALLSLAASYISEYFPAQKETYHQAELYYSTQALKALATQISSGESYVSAIATSMLLMHHGAINQEESPLCWSCHANVFDALPPDFTDNHSDPALFLHTQLVLARTAQTSCRLQNIRFHSLDTKNWPPAEAQKICGTLGFSPKLLVLISSITSSAIDTSSSNKLTSAHLFETQLQNLKQWTAESQGPEQEVLLATAEAFRLAALIYLHCRLYG